MKSLTILLVEKCHLAMNVYSLAKHFLGLEISKPGKVLIPVGTQSFDWSVRDRLFENKKLNIIQDKVFVTLQKKYSELKFESYLLCV